ncbi:hypothetical protein [Streptomyces sp. ALI-76-A]|uniref:hypothetical protein n=1 Tax=Streptomyces sp. ALI-76-A TaxID=3025736 RepID=UPI00256ECBB0|nr:hypothetical protein [Streptomyces sp. ALI-76-A]MDL5200243.1 hypothetical protein [Streptomyces sp. ALI-76-A]
MHRTTTTATLLATVAVSALSGCVTVQHPPASGPAATPSVPRPDARAQPQVVQAPAREALEMTGPSRRPEPAAPPPPAAASAPARTRQEPPPRTHPPRPARPEPRRPDAGQPRQPRVEIPDVPEAAPREQQDVCALGRKYGGWREDSPQTVICDRTYGR